MAGLDVGLLPQLINEYTQSMFPMKFFEYLAAGLPVVSTALPALREFSSIHNVARDEPSFSKAIAAELAGRGTGALPLDYPLLQKHTWDIRIDQMLNIIEETTTEAAKH